MEILLHFGLGIFGDIFILNPFWKIMIRKIMVKIQGLLLVLVTVILFYKKHEKFWGQMGQNYSEPFWRRPFWESFHKKVMLTNILRISWFYCIMVTTGKLPKLEPHKTHFGHFKNVHFGKPRPFLFGGFTLPNKKIIVEK